MAAGFRSAIAPWFVLLATLATVASIGARAGAEPHAQPDAGPDGKAVWRGKVESAIDGDTLRVRDADDKLQRVRILGIDAPENGQPFFAAARDHLGKLTAGREVEIAPRGADESGRTVARVRMNGNDVAIDMLGAGLAWFQKADTDEVALESEERRARARNLGLWIDKDPISPWDWRAAEKARTKGRKRPERERVPEAPRP